jgi:cytochrome c2
MQKFLGRHKGYNVPDCGPPYRNIERSSFIGEISRKTPRCWKYLLSLCVAILAVCLTPLNAQDTAQFFRTNCYSCHTIGGGRVTGPDLKDVTTRQKRDWLTNFVQDAKAVIDAGDPYALNLMKEARGVIMPRIPGLDAAMANALLDLVEKESRLEEPNFLGLQISDTPISEEDILRGKRIFQGYTRLEGGGPPCISCHSLPRIGLLGGGRIGPDLTKVYERLGGRRALASWLLAPATPTMGAVFRQHPLSQNEIPVLAALLEDHTKQSKEENPNVSRVNLLFLGLIVGALSLFGLNWTWHSRLANRKQTGGISRPRPNEHLQ